MAYQSRFLLALNFQTGFTVGCGTRGGGRAREALPNATPEPLISKHLAVYRSQTGALRLAVHPRIMLKEPADRSPRGNAGFTATARSEL